MVAVRRFLRSRLWPWREIGKQEAIARYYACIVEHFEQWDEFLVETLGQRTMNELKEEWKAREGKRG